LSYLLLYLLSDECNNNLDFVTSIVTGRIKRMGKFRCN